MLGLADIALSNIPSSCLRKYQADADLVVLWILRFSFALKQCNFILWLEGVSGNLTCLDDLSDSLIK